MSNDENTELVAGSSSLDIVSRGEYDIQIATAHKYPRSVKAFRDQALQLATLNEAIAGECGYALPRKDKNGQIKTIEGASIRFAEIIGSAWGNAHVGTRVIADDGEFITAQAVFHDLERNWKVVEEVQRRVTDKNGRRFSADMIAVTANAARSIAMRNAVLHGIPKALWEDIRLKARAVAAGDQRSLASKRLEAVKAFSAYGVTEAQILGTLGRDGIVDVTIDDLSTLFGILTAIKDGDITPEEAFRERADGEPIDMPREKAAPAAQSGPVAAPAEPQATTVAGNIVDRASGEILAPAEATFTPSTAGRPTGADPGREPADGGSELLDAAIKADPMNNKKLASKAQRQMIAAVASKHKNLGEEELNALLVERFTFTLATLPMALVNEALQFLNSIK